MSVYNNLGRGGMAVDIMPGYDVRLLPRSAISSFGFYFHQSFHQTIIFFGDIPPPVERKSQFLTVLVQIQRGTGLPAGSGPSIDSDSALTNSYVSTKQRLKLINCVKNV